LLKNLSQNPKLYELAHLCLQEERAGSPEHVTLRGLESHPDGVTRKLGQLLRLLIERPMHMIPDLHPEESLESLISKASKEVRSATTAKGLIKRKPTK
jgi:hypothetical protein